MSAPAVSAESMAIALCADGAARADAGDMTAAIERYQRAVDTAPTLLDLHLILANAQHLRGDVLTARATLRRALKCAARPDVTSEFTLGKALVDAGAGADAVPCFRRVHAERPDDAAAASALASALREAQQPEKAWTGMQAALRLAPTDPVVLFTAAMIRHDLADYAGAMRWCQRSLDLRPDAPGVTIFRGYLRHLLGDAAGGWHDFEARPRPRPDTAAALWTGESLEGRSLLVIGEQGVGDQFQFLRFVQHPMVQAASRVVISCQPDAVSLLRASGYTAVARDTAVFTDFHVPLLSLPLVLGEGADWRGWGDAYLGAPGAAPRTVSPVKRVGLVCAGNPAHRNDAARSMPSSILHVLRHSHPGLQFVDMQHGVCDTEQRTAQWERAVCTDWNSTAESLRTLDLLITVDTGIAHLAGALGVPVWILLPLVPDWRWGASGNRTAWYPVARLFRQPTRGDWSRVVTNVSAALSAATLG